MRSPWASGSATQQAQSRGRFPHQNPPPSHRLGQGCWGGRLGPSGAPPVLPEASPLHWLSQPHPLGDPEVPLGGGIGLGRGDGWHGLTASRWTQLPMRPRTRDARNPVTPSLRGRLPSAHGLGRAFPVHTPSTKARIRSRNPVCYILLLTFTTRLP